MRLNVYTEEILRGAPGDPPLAEIVYADYVSSRTGQPMRNYGLRIFVKSHPDLHYIPGRDDDRSAITFWLGPKDKNVIVFLQTLLHIANGETLRLWREKTAVVQNEAELAERARVE